MLTKISNKKQKILLRLVILTMCVFLLNSVNCKFVQGKGSTVTETVGNELNTELTIADLDWVACDISNDNSLPFTPQSSGGYTTDKTDTSLHARETTGTYAIQVGWYTSFEIVNEAFQLVFEAKAKAGHIDAVNLRIGIYDNQTKNIIYKINSIDSGEGCEFTTQLETPYIPFDTKIFLPETTEVLLFLCYADGWSANWNQEFWVQNLSIDNAIRLADYINSEITTIIPSTYTHPKELIWKDNYLYSIGYNATSTSFGVAKIDPYSGDFLDEYTVDGRGGLTFDDTNFWVSGSSIHKYDLSFSYIGSISKPFSIEGGMTTDGTYLYIPNYATDLIHKVNRDTGATISTIPSPGTRSRGLEYHDGFLWVTDTDSSQFFKISTDIGTILETYDSPFKYPYGIAVDDDGYVWLSIQFGSTIMKTSVNVNPDTDPPVIISSSDVEYEVGSISNFISWVLEDDNPKTYEIYRDGTITTLATSWTNGQNVSVNVDLLSVGTHNYTLVAKDSYDNEASSTIWVTVTDPEETSFYWLSLLVLISVPIISKRRRK